MQRIFKTAQRFTSDEDLRGQDKIRVFHQGELSIPSEGTFRGLLMVQVRRPWGWGRVYVKGVVQYEVEQSECSCCDILTGTFYPHWTFQ